MRRLLLLAVVPSLLLANGCGDESAVSGPARPDGDASQGDIGSAVADVAAEPDADAPEDVDGSGEPAADTVPDGSADGDDGSGDAAADPDTEPGDVEGRPVQRITMPGADGLPERFDRARDGAGAGPAVVYPEDGTRLPRNTVPPVIQWEGPGDDAYRVNIFTDDPIWEIYTTDWQWQPNQLQWERLVSDGRRGGVVVSVSRIDSRGEIVTSTGVRLSFSTASVDGAVYYWTPDQSGITRLPMGSPAPEPFLSASVFNCVGCHALSPDGSRLAYTRSGGGTPIGTLGVVGTDDARTQYVAENRLSLYYPSFSPDNIHLAAGSNGDVVVLNTDTGVITETLPKPDGMSANFPAWSPRGDTIVYAAGPAGFADSLGVSESGLARVRRTPGGWSAAEWLVEQGDAGGMPENLFYPAFSPDGRWVVFNRAESGAAVGGSPADSELWIVSGGGGSAIRLDAANGEDFATNSWPRWAPSSGDGTLWVAFTSNRRYGRLGGGQPQIWIAAVDASTAAPGFDPSSAAYWMPGQSLTASNHVAYWAPYDKD
jgi:Tol biopolymer transport system component